MWPFRRRGLPEEIDLEELKALADSNPTKNYVYLLLLDLVDRGMVEYTLRESESLPLPEPEPLRGCSVELPTFDRADNCLKVMAGLDPLKYPQRKEGRIAAYINGMDIVIHVLFDDTSDDRSVQSRFEKVGPSPADKPS